MSKDKRIVIAEGFKSTPPIAPAIGELSQKTYMKTPAIKPTPTPTGGPAQSSQITNTPKK
ncbi:hypothetical protein GOE05_12720 [Sinorhizobium medicae]|nr:hypothetical protein [Sinorhizobium medicae]